ncbi:MAG: (2Fe-2S)-binding protein [Anaerolineales bacterium]|nr:(2Fe-2S)-binding protein [Anaerolineales bacterium]
MADEEKVPAEEADQAPMKISRRDFLVGAGAGVVVTGAVAAGIVALQEPKTVEVIKEVPVEVIKEVPVTTEGEPVPVTTVGTTLPASMRAVDLKIDGKVHSLVVDVRESLWETMTRKLGMGSAINLGCDRAQCGACAVVVDGRAMNGCSILSARLGRGQEITTVAGLATGTTEADLHPVQKAYWNEGGYQCGLCTRGFIMSTYALLTHNNNPSEEEVREALSGNICRCSEYPKIFDSVSKAAELMRAA